MPQLLGLSDRKGAKEELAIPALLAVRYEELQARKKQKNESRESRRFNDGI